MNRIPIHILPERLSARELEYYRDTWGFDPLKDKIEDPPLPPDWHPDLLKERPGEDPPHPPDWGEFVNVREPEPDPELYPQYFDWPLLYHYEATVPLENDPELGAAGVAVRVRVDVDIRGETKNRVIFSRGDQSAEFQCMHTIIYAAPAQEVLSLSGAELEARATSSEFNPAILPPWEHFVALKSYVSGIASVGFLDAIDILFNDTDESSLSLVLGKNTEIVDQLLQILFKVAPNAMMGRFMKVLGDILERMPLPWLAKRWRLIARNYHAYEALAHVAFWDALPVPAQEKVQEIVRNLNKRVRARYPHLFDAEIEKIALPEIDICHGRGFSGFIYYTRVYNVRNAPVNLSIYPQVLVRTVFVDHGRDDSIYYRESLDEDDWIHVIGGEYLCPKGATRSQWFKQMCVLAEEMATMDGDALHRAAARCRELKSQDKPIGSPVFLNFLAEYDLTTARHIASNIQMNIIGRNFLRGLNFLKSRPS